MFCKKCGCKNTDDALFCCNCGNSLVSSDSEQSSTPTKKEKHKPNTLSLVLISIAALLIIGACSVVFILLSGNIGKTATMPAEPADVRSDQISKPQSDSEPEELASPNEMKAYSFAANSISEEFGLYNMETTAVDDDGIEDDERAEEIPQGLYGGMLLDMDGGGSDEFICIYGVLEEGIAGENSFWAVIPHIRVYTRDGEDAVQLFDATSGVFFLDPDEVECMGIYESSGTKSLVISTSHDPAIEAFSVFSFLDGALSVTEFSAYAESPEDVYTALDEGMDKYAALTSFFIDGEETDAESYAEYADEYLQNMEKKSLSAKDNPKEMLDELLSSF